MSAEKHQGELVYPTDDAGDRRGPLTDCSRFYLIAATISAHGPYDDAPPAMGGVDEAVEVRETRERWRFV